MITGAIGCDVIVVLAAEMAGNPFPGVGEMGDSGGVGRYWAYERYG